MEETTTHLPEVLPLWRVSPVWKYLAMTLLVLFTAVSIGFLALLIGFLHLQTRGIGPAVPVTVGAAPPIMPAPPLPPGTPGAPQDPFPIREDLRPAPTIVQSDLRDQFLKLSREAHSLDAGQLPDFVRVSPDGTHLAIALGSRLLAGPFAGQLNEQYITSVAQMTPGGRTFFTAAEQVRLVGPPAWSPDSRYLYYARTRGRIGLNAIQQAVPPTFVPRAGDCPAPFPVDGDKSRYAFVRALPTGKLEGRPLSDGSEVLISDGSNSPTIENTPPTVLIPASGSSWTELAVSPDGKRLALIGNRGFETETPPRFRVFVTEIPEKGPAGDPQPLSPPATAIGSLCWTTDGKGLIYARTQDAPPADILDQTPPQPRYPRQDLFLWNLEKKEELRLSRGGGFSSPSVTTDGQLYFVNHTTDGSLRAHLRQVALDAVTSFAVKTPNPPSLDAPQWSALLEKLQNEARVSLDNPDAEGLQRLAEIALKQLPATLQTQPFETPQQLDKLQQLLTDLKLPEKDRARASLILGALRGGWLQTHSQGTWQLDGPIPGEKLLQENLFVVAWNPFVLQESFAAAVDRAEGRPFVLTVSPETAKTVVAAHPGAELALGEQFLRDGKADEAEDLLLALLTKKEHARNDHLLIHVGGLLYENKRTLKLRKLLDARAQQPPLLPRKFNLMGLVLLQNRDKARDMVAETQLAADQFRNALRCDLKFGPAYLNLAEAHELLNELAPGQLCLQRYLELFPNGPYAMDARRRLGRMGVEGE